MSGWFADTDVKKAVPVHAVAAEGLEEGLRALPGGAAAFARAAGFKGEAGEILHAPTSDGGIERVIFGVGKGDDPFVFGALAMRLTEGDYAVEGLPEGLPPDLVALGWAQGAYVFDRYKKAEPKRARLVAPKGCDVAAVERAARAINYVRDLVNTPANDMGPLRMEAAADRFIDDYGANVRVTVGESLEQYGYPLVHAVGRASNEEPRVIEIEWGEEDAPVVAIVGKGITFDSGGLNIKTGNYMRLMKKDMGGAAHALGLAQLIIESQLACRLHVIVPVAENAIGPGAFRPGDVLKSRSGKTIEIDNTDAEGRLVLADALTRATEHEPRVIIDFATLTGAARVALGPEVAPYYATDDKLAAILEKAAGELRDPVWRMPLWDGYERHLDSAVADMKNTGEDPFAGSIAAALFLRRFVGAAAWVHFDIFAWSPSPRPGRPKGGEAQALRAAYALLKSVVEA